MNTLVKPVRLGTTWSMRLGATLRTNRWPDRTRLPVFAAILAVTTAATAAATTAAFAVAIVV